MSTAATSVESRVAAFAADCRRHGMKPTHQRTEIYRAMVRTGEHPSADSVYRAVRRRVPAISLDTVYRTLRLLEEKNVIWRVGSVEDRTRFDANPERHHHFVCQSCGRVIDFHSDEMDALRAPHASSAIGKVDYVHVELRGTCAHCQARRAGKK